MTNTEIEPELPLSYAWLIGFILTVLIFEVKPSLNEPSIAMTWTIGSCLIGGLTDVASDRHGVFICLTCQLLLGICSVSHLLSVYRILMRRRKGLNLIAYVVTMGIMHSCGGVIGMSFVLIWSTANAITKVRRVQRCRDFERGAYILGIFGASLLPEQTENAITQVKNEPRRSQHSILLATLVCFLVISTPHIIDLLPSGPFSSLDIEAYFKTILKIGEKAYCMLTECQAISIFSPCLISAWFFMTKLYSHRALWPLSLAVECLVSSSS